MILDLRAPALAGLLILGGFAEAQSAFDRIVLLQLESYNELRAFQFELALLKVRETYPLYMGNRYGVSGSTILEARALIGLGKLNEAGEAFKKGFYWSGEGFFISGSYFEAWAMHSYAPEYAEYLARVGRIEDAKLVLYSGLWSAVPAGGSLPRMRFQFESDPLGDSWDYSLDRFVSACYVLKFFGLLRGMENEYEPSRSELLDLAIQFHSAWYYPRLLKATFEENEGKRGELFALARERTRSDLERRDVDMVEEMARDPELFRRDMNMRFLTVANEKLGASYDYFPLWQKDKEGWQRVATLRKNIE